MRDKRYLATLLLNIAIFIISFMLHDLILLGMSGLIVLLCICRSILKDDANYKQYIEMAILSLWVLSFSYLLLDKTITQMHMQNMSFTSH